MYKLQLACSISRDLLVREKGTTVSSWWLRISPRCCERSVVAVRRYIYVVSKSGTTACAEPLYMCEDYY